MTSLERRLIDDDDDGAAAVSHYLPSLLIATYAGATTVAPPGRAARERGRPALCANVLDEFVRALLPRSTSRRAGRPVGSTPLRVRTVFFKAVMFLLHCLPPHRSSYPACRFLSPPALIRSSQSTRPTRGLRRPSLLSSKQSIQIYNPKTASKRWSRMPLDPGAGRNKWRWPEFTVARSS